MRNPDKATKRVHQFICRNAEELIDLLFEFDLFFESKWHTGEGAMDKVPRFLPGSWLLVKRYTEENIITKTVIGAGLDKLD